MEDIYNTSNPTERNDSSIEDDGDEVEVNFPAEFITTTYGIIFFFAIFGNLLVIVTLIKHRSMRTVTNLLLLNLSVADFCFAVFIMPYTVTQHFVENYIFGTVACKLIPYIQAVMVTVSAFTLTSVSLERYFAICRPLSSRKWQTISHAYKLILVIWLLSACCMLPIALVSRVVNVQNDKLKCVEAWGQVEPGPTLRLTFTLFLDMILFLLPLTVMCVAYGKVVQALYNQMHFDNSRPNSSSINSDTSLKTSQSNISSTSKTREWRINPSKAIVPHPVGSSHYLSTIQVPNQINLAFNTKRLSHEITPVNEFQLDTKTPVSQMSVSMRVFNQRNARSKHKIVCMLIVIVIEFFTCWTPTFAIQTWDALDQQGARDSISARQFTLIVLISYISTICNPITYGFLNGRFRAAFLQLLRTACGIKPCSTPHRRQLYSVHMRRDEKHPRKWIYNAANYQVNGINIKDTADL